jgi:hypothetical protein
MYSKLYICIARDDWKYGTGGNVISTETSKLKVVGRNKRKMGK